MMKRFLKLLAVATLVWGALPLVAQNIIVNGDFEASNGYIEFTDYERTFTPNVVEAGHYAIDNTTNGYGGGLGWPQPINSNGNYMMVNGFGGSTNPTKVVWRQTVSVTTQTNYELAYRVVNLNRPFYGQVFPAKLQMKINGVDLGSAYQLPGNNEWQTQTYPWNSGTSTQAIVEIYDICTDPSNFGDDFCIDDISLIPGVVYSAEANNDYPSEAVCLNFPTDIDVLANDIFHPNANDVTVTVVSNPERGTATVLENKKIRYSYTDAGYAGAADQFKYGVNNHGVTSEAWVTLTLSRAPTVGEITPPEDICAGESFVLTPPAIDDNGSTITNQGWEIAPTATGTFTPFNPEENNLALGDYFLRFVVSNGCGSDASNVVPLRVNDAPIVQGQLDDFQVCAGETLPLPNLDVMWNNVNEIDRFTQWQMSQDGTEFSGFDPSMVMQATHDGCWVRFKATNFCGDGYLGPVRIRVISEADVYETVFECDFCVLPSGEIITESQTIEYEIEEPCPHTLHCYYEIHYTDTMREPITSCHDVFEWHGQTYYRSEGTQVGYWRTNNIHGCDSIVELRLDFGPNAVITERVTACNDYVWPRNGMHYTESQIDSVYIHSTDDQVCDSMIYLELTLGHDLETQVDTAACESFWWPSAGIWCHNGQETYEHKFATLGGCDSVVTMNVRWLSTEYSTQFLAKCDSITINGVLYDQPGNYYVYLDTILSQTGCDSIIFRINLTLNDSDQIGLIQGDTNVFVATNLVTGIYRYEIDNESIIGKVAWKLSNPDWMVYDYEDNWCRVLAATPGKATLTAKFAAECGEMERNFIIFAGFYDVDDCQSVAVKVFPNPSEGVFTVQAERLVSVKVINAMGQMLRQSENDGSDSLTLNLTDLEPSVYLLEIRTEIGTVMRQVVISK